MRNVEIMETGASTSDPRQELTDDDILRIAHYLVKNKRAAVERWERVKRQSHEDVLQIACMAVVAYRDSDKYAKYCARKAETGESPMPIGYCALSYAARSVERIFREERIVPSESLDWSPGDSRDGNERIASTTTTTSAPVDRVIELLRKGDTALTPTECREWWREVFTLDGGDGLDPELQQRLFELRPEELGALVLVEIFGIDRTVLSDVTAESTHQLSLLVTAAQEAMRDNNRLSPVVIDPPQPQDCFHALQGVIQTVDLFGSVVAEDWVSSIEHRLVCNVPSRCVPAMGV